jgi:hypothetical protein
MAAKYQKSFTVSNGAKTPPLYVIRGKKGTPCYPDFPSGLPPVYEKVYLFYDNTGQFLGWTTIEAGNKFIYTTGYRTGNMYKIVTKDHQNNPINPKGNYVTIKYLVEKIGYKIALFMIEAELTPFDLAEANDKMAQVQATLDTLRTMTLNQYNYKNINDPFKILDVEIKKNLAVLEPQLQEVKKKEQALEAQYQAATKALEKEEEKRYEEYKQRLIDNLEQTLKGKQDMAQKSKELGVDLDI